MNGSVRLIAFTSIALSACVGPADSLRPGADAASSELEDIDAAALECVDRGELTIGQCIDTATDLPCRDFESPNRSFVEITSSSIVPQIIGLQGSPMFVLALRTPVPERDDDARPPLVQLEISLGDRFVGGYTARPELIEAPDLPGHRIAPQLYLVTLLGAETSGQTVDVVARMSTDTGLQQCGHESFEVGMLVGAVRELDLFVGVGSQ